MKYMIMLYGSQRDYDAMEGKDTGDRAAWTPEQLQEMSEFMGTFNQELIDSGEFVDGQGLTAPVHTRRITGMKDGAPIVTEGPYAETTEVLVGFNIIDVASFDRAVELAARITQCPGPDGMGGQYVDVRPIDEGPGADE